MSNKQECTSNGPAEGWEGRGTVNGAQDFFLFSY